MRKKANPNLGDVVANGTIQAAVDMLHRQGKGVADVNVDALVEALRREAKAAIGTILDEGRVLVESGMGGWADTLVRTECVDAARRAIASI